VVTHRQPRRKTGDIARISIFVQIDCAGIEDKGFLSLSLSLSLSLFLVS